jgi:hypothetical protein
MAIGSRGALSCPCKPLDGAQKFRGARLETGPSIEVKASYGVTVSVTGFCVVPGVMFDVMLAVEV